MAVLFAAALTTLAGVWTAMAAMVAVDFGLADATRVRAQRIWILVFAALSWLGGVFLVDDILNRLILANIPVAGLAFALLAGFHWKRATAAGAWASMCVGNRVGRGLVRGDRRGRRLHLDLGDLRHPAHLRHRHRGVTPDCDRGSSQFTVPSSKSQRHLARPLAAHASRAHPDCCDARLE